MAFFLGATSQARQPRRAGSVNLSASDFDFTIFSRHPRPVNVQSVCKDSVPYPMGTTHGSHIDRRLSLDVALDRVSQCPHLTRLKLTSPGWRPFPPAKTQIIVLRRLRALSLHFGSRHFMQVFDVLSGPTLEELFLAFSDQHFRPWDPGTPWAEAPFTAFQLRTSNLTRQDIRHSNIASNDLRIALAHVPSLTHLKTYHCRTCPDTTLLLALSYSVGAEPEPLAPRLQYLSLLAIPRVGSGIILSQAALADIITSRSWSVLDSETSHKTVSRLKHVELSASAFKFENPFLGAMKDLKRKGFKVSGVQDDR
ncbi:hypothetical protein B0H14DRAFT_3125775 [Mycena olivaceomarginata]|nr:hypothetical protein B0H14DRAFT_3125775 [Mycena olivaceomarginata]